MEYVYHGSSVHGIKTMTPHKSTHGNYVYATESKIIAIVMSHKIGGDSIYSFGSYDKQVYDLVERVPYAFDKMYNNPFSLYILDASYFKNINTGFNEVVSEVEVPVLNEEVYSNSMDSINQLVSEGKLRVYRYPERPEYIPDDDSDLIDKIKRNYLNKGTNPLTKDLARWIFLHPNLESEIRKIAEENNITLPSYDEIKQRFIAAHESDKNHEFWIESAQEMEKLYKQNIASRK